MNDPSWKAIIAWLIGAVVILSAVWYVNIAVAKDRPYIMYKLEKREIPYDDCIGIVNHVLANGHKSGLDVEVPVIEEEGEDLIMMEIPYTLRGSGKQGFTKVRCANGMMIIAHFAYLDDAPVELKI